MILNDKAYLLKELIFHIIRNLKTENILFDINPKSLTQQISVNFFFGAANPLIVHIA